MAWLTTDWSSKQWHIYYVIIHIFKVINKKMYSLFCTLFSVSAMQKLLKSVKIWQSCSHIYTATFQETRQKCRFWFFQVRFAHKSGDVINFIIVAFRISSRLKWYKNCKNWLRLAKVIVKNKMSRFYGSLCIVKTFCWGQHTSARNYAYRRGRIVAINPI